MGAVHTSEASLNIPQALRDVKEFSIFSIISKKSATPCFDGHQYDYATHQVRFCDPLLRQPSIRLLNSSSEIMPGIKIAAEICQMTHAFISKFRYA